MNINQINLSLNNWYYKDFFTPTSNSELHFVVDSIEKYIEEVKLDQHDFFEYARNNRQALLLWVSQELVMTNAFSQIVLYAASQIKNVHIRSVLAEVAYGEHGRCKNGLAARSHPWLLNQLRESVNLTYDQVTPKQPTVNFINRLFGMLESPLSAIAGIGVGNERLIEPEYKAIKKCFEELIPDCKFVPFLDANLNEDITHSRLCYEAATALICTDGDAKKFFESAKQSIDSRVRYFDELLVLAKI